MNYRPSQDVLDKYARILVNFALNSGAGVKSHEVVRLLANESAKPLFVAVRDQLLRSGAHPLLFYYPDGIDRAYFELAQPHHLDFFPSHYFRGLVNQIDHSIGIISETNKHELEGIDPAKIMRKTKSAKKFKTWLDQKENQGKFTWTLALYGTPAMATEAGMPLSGYWDQIIKACFLDQSDPISSWRQVTKENERVRLYLNSLSIDRLHIEGQDVDLWIKMGTKRKWLGGSGRNIPSFEIFTSPDWRGTQGWINFNQPLYRYGNLIEGIKLRFDKGVVVESSATKNYQVLKDMLLVKNADKVGEFSLTDKRMSRIDKFMAETLFDENMSGPFGNTHIALGSSYHDTFDGDPAKNTPTQWKQMGFNDSVIHTDIISTTDRTVTAHLPDGSQKVIYQNGMFVI